VALGLGRHGGILTCARGVVRVLVAGVETPCEGASGLVAQGILRLRLCFAFAKLNPRLIA
jgi:hypothetical protein